MVSTFPGISTGGFELATIATMQNWQWIWKGLNWTTCWTSIIVDFYCKAFYYKTELTPDYNEEYIHVARGATVRVRYNFEMTQGNYNDSECLHLARVKRRLTF